MKKNEIAQIWHTHENHITTLTIDEQGKLSDCAPLSQTELLNVRLSEKLRLLGIRISSETKRLHLKKFSTANFSFVGDEEKVPQIAYKRTNLSDSTSLFAFMNLTEELKIVSIKVASTASVDVCHLEIFAFPNECGHPEIPINGTVTWQRGSPTATYYCREGYHLEPNTKTRTCEEGKWSGTEPLCKLFQFKTFEDQMKETEDTATSPM